jgi:transcriptional regulator with XRE-family HTH domain
MDFSASPAAGGATDGPAADRPLSINEPDPISHAQRKAQGITQVELAETLGVSQQAMNSFEKGRRRVPVSLLPVIAQTLQTTLDALVDHDSTPAITAPKKRGPQKKIQQQLQQIEALPVTKQRLVVQMIDAVIAQATR